MSPVTPADDDHAGYLRLCLGLARMSPAIPTNFRVGAALVHAPTNTILSTGYTNELPGNTHAEQVCFLKLAKNRGIDEQDLASVPEVEQGQTILYTTVEPCTKRLSGNISCTQRILSLKTISASGIGTVYVGVHEPDTFIQDNNAKTLLEAAGVNFKHIPGMEDEILRVATAGHK